MTTLKPTGVILLIFMCISPCNKTFAWGPEGHAIVGRLAMRLIRDDVRKNILAILGNMSVDTAANWMDIMKSNQDYDFMRSWHYIDFAKGQAYQASNNDNIVNRLLITYNELDHKKTLCSDQIKTDLLILLHLMGDLHMPLHTGYDDDLGGNKRIVQYDTIKTHNLHTFWDIDIINLAKITDEDCMQYYNKATADSIKNVDFEAWMKDTRSLLDNVYNFTDYNLDKAYLTANKIIVEKQLLKAGERLALILNKLFYQPAAVINFKELTARYKNGIDIREAKNNIGKKVTICSKVMGVKTSPTITQISLEEKFPNSPLTIIVFGKNYGNFTVPLEEMRDKNYCIKGIITAYKEKVQIEVQSPEDIMLQ